MARKHLSPLNLVNLTADPGTATEGDFYWNSSTNKLRVYYDGAWADATQAASVYQFSATAPSSPTAGDYWIDSTTGSGYVYVSDGDSSQWVDLESNGYIGSSISLTSSNPVALGSVAVGTASDAARADHVHPTTGLVTTSSLGSGVSTALGLATGVTGAFVVNGGALGTPSSGNLSNATSLPISTGVSGLGSGVATFLSTPSSSNLSSALTDKTGSGGNVFATSPTITNLSLSAGTTSLASVVINSGSLLNTPVTGAVEFDGSTPYFTNNTTSGRNLLETSIFMTNGIYTVPLKNATTAQPLFGAFVAAAGTLGTPTGTGPWTVVITGVSNTGGFRPGTTITATAGAGSFNTNTVTIISVDSATQITVSATGGTIPTAGTVTNITSTTTGAVTLPANTAYMLEAWFPGISNATSSTKTFSITGTATFTVFTWETLSSTTTAGGTTVNAGTVWNNATSITSNSTASATITSVLLKGYFKTNASGTFIPNLTFSAGGASTMNGGSYIKLTPVGTGSAFGLGSWA
jgi:hypothetical protein